MNQTVLLTISILAGSAVLCSAANPVNKWNEVAVEATLTAGEGAVPQTRTLAIVQAAVHDALNSIEPRYERYAFEGKIQAAASPEAAIAAAAHDALAGAISATISPSFGSALQHAAAIAQLDAERDAELAAIPNGPLKSLGILVGQAAAAAIIQLRSNDRAISAAQAPYTPGTAPGDWQPTPNPDPASPAGVGSLKPAAQPGWGLVTPFVLRRSTQFEPAGPPRLSSRRYARDFNELKSIGSQFSLTRTDEQSTIAMYWYENASAIWSRFDRVLADAYHLDYWQTARLLALTNLAMTDSVIAGFQAKYDFNRWRPVTAIRAGDFDGNRETVGDSTWSTFLNTPPHPDYPSTHSEEAGSAAEVMRRFFHSDCVPFTATSGVPFAGLTRSYRSFTQASVENEDARIYAGIHSRNAVEAGTRQGVEIGRFVFDRVLRPLDHERCPR